MSVQIINITRYFFVPKNPLIIAVAPVLITELSAFVAARLAIVCADVCLPPSSELTIFVLTDLATDDVALVTAFCAALETSFFFLSFSF